MVKSGVMRHPGEWMYIGYHEIQNTKQRYSLINRPKLADLLGIKDTDQSRDGKIAGPQDLRKLQAAEAAIHLSMFG